MIPPKLHIVYDIDTSRLEKIGERATDLRPTWIADIQPLITDFLTQRFDTEGAFGGEKWVELAPVTLELRKRPGHGRGGIGRDTGAMWASWVKSVGSAPAPGGILAIEKDRYERGSSVPQSLWFSQGINSVTVPVQTKKGWVFVYRKEAVRTAARPIIPDPLPASLVEQIQLSVAAYLSGSNDR